MANSDAHPGPPVNQITKGAVSELFLALNNQKNKSSSLLSGTTPDT